MGQVMRRPPFFEAEDDVECPDCGRDVPVRAEICPHCEAELL